MTAAFSPSAAAPCVGRTLPGFHMFSQVMVIPSLRDRALGGELQHVCLDFWGLVVEEIYSEKLCQDGWRI